MAKVEAMTAQFTKYLDDAGVDVVLTPCTVGPPAAALTSAEYGDPASLYVCSSSKSELTFVQLTHVLKFPSKQNVSKTSVFAFPLFGASVWKGHSEKDQNCLARKGEYRKRDL